MVQFFLGGIGAAGAKEAAVAVLAAIGTGGAEIVEEPFASAMSSRAVDFIAAAKGAKGRAIFGCRFFHENFLSSEPYCTTFGGVTKLGPVEFC